MVRLQAGLNQLDQQNNDNAQQADNALYLQDLRW
jgi:hypothetical protein